MGSNGNEERASSGRGVSKAPLQYETKGAPLASHKRFATGNKTINDPHGVGPVDKSNKVGNSDGKNY